MEQKNGPILTEKPFKVGEAWVNPKALEVTIAGKVHKIQPLVMQALLVLVKSEGEVVLRRNLVNELWPDVIVGEEALTKTISKLRRIFSNSTQEQTYIETVPKVGYRLLASVTQGEDSKAPSSKLSVTPGISINRQIKWLWSAVATLLLLLVGQWYMNINEVQQERGLVDWYKIRTLSDSTHHIPLPKDMAAFRSLADSVARENPGMKLRQPAPPGN